MTTIEKIFFCRQNGMKMNELTNRLGVSRQFIHKVLHGQRKLSKEKEVILDGILDGLGYGLQVDNHNVTHDKTVDLSFQKEVIDRLSSIEQLLIKLLGSNTSP